MADIVVQFPPVPLKNDAHKIWKIWLNFLIMHWTSQQTHNVYYFTLIVCVSVSHLMWQERPILGHRHRHLMVNIAKKKRKQNKLGDKSDIISKRFELSLKCYCSWPNVSTLQSSVFKLCKKASGKRPTTPPPPN